MLVIVLSVVLRFAFLDDERRRTIELTARRVMSESHLSNKTKQREKQQTLKKVI
jgi:hypothetical protein